MTSLNQPSLYPVPFFQETQRASYTVHSATKRNEGRGTLSFILLSPLNRGERRRRNARKEGQGKALGSLGMVKSRDKKTVKSRDKKAFVIF